MTAKKKSDTPGVDRPIRREDLEGRLRDLKDDVDMIKESTLGLGIAAGGIALLVLLVIVFLLGKRRGKKKYAFLEIRRV